MLHQYNKKFIRKQTQKQAQRRQETREAVIYDVLPAQRKCRVKIQGVETLIVANYPLNWELTPEYLKPGNPVTIRHIAGNRHRVDVIAHGYVTPTKVTSGTYEVGEDAILSGMEITAMDPPRMAVYIAPGEYRIAGEDYEFNNDLVMAADSEVTMGDDVTMGDFGGVVEIDAASSSTYRFDLIVIGVDGVLDYVKGTGSATDPEMPAVPSGHVMVGWVFVPKGLTAVTDAWINATYSDPIVSQLEVTLSDDELTTTINPTPPPPYIYEMTSTMTVKVQDQYGNAITGTNWGVTASFISGTGTIDGLTVKTRYTSTSSNTVNFVYERNIEVDEKSPMIRFELTQDTGVFNATYILILDSLGNPMF